MALYLSAVKDLGNKFVVASTSDNESKEVTRAQLIKVIQSGTVVHGAFWTGKYLMTEAKCKNTLLLDSLSGGMPIRYKVKNNDWKHAIYVGKMGENYCFVDDGTEFTFSSGFLYRSGKDILISSYNIDPVKVMDIRRRID